MKFEQYRDANNQYRWRLIAANGRIIANSGEGYHNSTDCDRAVALVKSTTQDTPYVLG